jgi:hypothetical protein
MDEDSLNESLHTSNPSETHANRTTDLDQHCRSIRVDSTGKPLEDEYGPNGKRNRYCQYCDKSYDVVSNFRQHLKIKHNVSARPQKPKVQQLTKSLQDLSFDSQTTTINQKIFNLHLVRLIVTRNLPFSITEWPEFHALLQILNPDAEQYLQTSHNAIQPLIRTAWIEKKKDIQNWLQTAHSPIHISVDIWTSPNSYLFLGVVAFFVRQDENQISKLLLGLSEIGGHSGEAQFEILSRILNDYQISRTIGFLIGDNSTTNDVLCRTISTWQQDEFGIAWDSEQNRLRCLGHIINLIVQAFLFSSTSLKDLESYDKEEQEEIEPDTQQTTRDHFRTMGVVGKIHNITVHIRGSASRMSEFVNEAGNRIPLDNRTRWNSWFHMICRACDLEKHIDFYVKNQPDLQNDALSANEWAALRTTKKFLELCHSITMQNEGDQGNISETFPSLVLIWLQCKAEIQSIKKIKVFTISYETNKLIYIEIINS